MKISQKDSKLFSITTNLAKFAINYKKKKKKDYLWVPFLITSNSRRNLHTTNANTHINVIVQTESKKRKIFFALRSYYVLHIYSHKK